MQEGSEEGYMYMYEERGWRVKETVKLKVMQTHLFFLMKE